MTTTAWRWAAPKGAGADELYFEQVELADPGPGEVLVDVRACGVNPADHKHLGRDADADPQPIGYEVAGVIAALGPDAVLGSGGGAVGDPVLAFRIRGGYASAVVVPAKDVFARPAGLGEAEAANLLLAGTTAAEMLHVTGVQPGESIVLHGASGAVGVSVLQQAAPAGIRVVGTASAAHAEVVRRFGGEPVTYGDGLEARLRERAPDGFAAALDAAGTDEALDTSLALVADRERIVTVVTGPRAQAAGIRSIGGTMPASAAFRDSVRGRLVELAGNGRLVVPVARTYPLDRAREALEFLRGGHPGGKLALVPGPDPAPPRLE